MNSAVPGFSSIVSGTGPAAVGCSAGSVTVNMAVNGLPLISNGCPLRVCSVRFDSYRVTVKVPKPEIVNGGAVYSSGSRRLGGSSSPSRHAVDPQTISDSADPSRGTGASRAGITAGGGIVMSMVSPVRSTKSPTGTSPYLELAEDKPLFCVVVVSVRSLLTRVDSPFPSLPGVTTWHHQSQTQLHDHRGTPGVCAYSLWISGVNMHIHPPAPGAALSFT